MEMEFRRATVEKILKENKDVTEVLLNIDHDCKVAINYNTLTGKVKEGDTVLVNTTACTLGLGTGGYHFIMANLNLDKKELTGRGHGIKMKYTPVQVKLLLAEEAESIYHPYFNQPVKLDRKIVYIGELHSMLPPLCAYLKFFAGEKIRIAYIMTDHGALPLAFSKNVSMLRRKGLLDVTITIGNAFGGDLECVNIYTGLQAAFNIENCDVAIITMGPGILGTGTRFGFSGLELGLYVDLIWNLEGVCLYIPRISFNDCRIRHCGMSHHSLTVLKEIVKTSLPLVLPAMGKNQLAVVFGQLKRHNLLGKHKIHLVDGREIKIALDFYDVNTATMGRGIRKEPFFFYTLGSYGKFGLRYL